MPRRRPKHICSDTERKEYQKTEKERSDKINSINKKKLAFLKDYEELCYKHKCYLAHLYSFYAEIEDKNNEFRTIEGHIRSIKIN